MSEANQSIGGSLVTGTGSTGTVIYANVSPQLRRPLIPEKPTDIEVIRLNNRERIESHFSAHDNRDWNSLSYRVGILVDSVIHSVVKPLSEDVLFLFQDDYDSLRNYYKEQFLFEPLIFRWGKTVVVFNESKLPPILLEIKKLLKEVEPESKAVASYLHKNPEKIFKVFSDGALPVWINDRLYVFDSKRWTFISSNYIMCFYQFDYAKGWNVDGNK